jgi:mono/diheme cytochrome c family protein
VPIWQVLCVVYPRVRQGVARSARFTYNGADRLNVFHYFRYEKLVFDVPSQHPEEAFMKYQLALIGIVAMLLLAAPAFAAGDAAAGKELFAKKCASCHGAAGEGKESIAKMMKVEMHHLGAKEVQSKSDADLNKIATQGVGKMKAVTGIDAKGADDLVAYMRTLKK